MDEDIALHVMAMSDDVWRLRQKQAIIRERGGIGEVEVEKRQGKARAREAVPWRGVYRAVASLRRKSWTTIIVEFTMRAQKSCGTAQTTKTQISYHLIAPYCRHGCFAAQVEKEGARSDVCPTEPHRSLGLRCGYLEFCQNSRPAIV
jgi:hypothetical protein